MLGTTLLFLLGCPGAEPEPAGAAAEPATSSLPSTTTDPSDPGCAAGLWPKAQLRLLTRREYDASVADLLPGLQGATCSEDPDCDLGQSSCVGGVCVADPCQLHTFLLPADAPLGSVHVAGEFNGWASTVAAGGWPMAWDPVGQRYYLKREVADGSYAYKFVVNEATWLQDPSNPAAVSDGFGGFNSLLLQDCASAPPVTGVASPSATFLPESRPTGFPFDNAAEANLVSAVHVEQYLDAGEALAARAVVDAAAFLGCEPTDSACRRAWVERFGRQAWRRPLTSEEVDTYSALADAELELAVWAFLNAPGFLYRSEVGVDQGDGTRLLDPHEVAAALSFLFVGAPPDAELQRAADDASLHDPAVREAHARRLLQDPRARAQVGHFAQHWLAVDSLETKDKATFVHPDFNDRVRAALKAEVADFSAYVTFDGARTFRELLTADFTVAGPEVAELYGLTASGPGTVLPFGDDRRAGVLGLASVLASHAHSDQSSPVRRGLLVRERILCQELGTPPPDAGGVPQIDPDATTRERFEQHSSDPACAACHRFIDPVGFGFEHFDAVGVWRDQEAGQPVDASGDLVDVEGLGTGTSQPFDSLPALAEALLASEAAPRCLVTQWSRFASGQPHPEDWCGQVELLDLFLQSEGNLQELFVALAASEAFVRRSP